MSSNINPGVHTYTAIKPFRAWCQKVLPLVYDDSLSYYELLCKLVEYLNKVLNDLTNMGQDITALNQAFQELQAYVNNYFDNLDVQEEINNKLDQMVQDGTLASLIFDKYLPIYVAENPVTVENMIWKNITEVYALFDQFVTDGVVTKSTIGYGSLTGNPTTETDAQNDTTLPINMYSYRRVINQMPTTGGTVFNSNGLVLIIGAVHGNEKMHIPALLTFLNEIKVGTNRFVNWLTANFDFDIIPVFNPGGFNTANTAGGVQDMILNNIGRTNNRGVNLNRNQPYGWSYAGSYPYGTVEYKGTNYLTETESKLFNSTLNDSKYCYVFDLHGANIDVEHDDARVFGQCFATDYVLPYYWATMEMLYDRFKTVYGQDMLDYPGNMGGSPGYNGQLSGAFMAKQYNPWCSALIETRKMYTYNNPNPDWFQKMVSEYEINVIYNLLKKFQIDSNEQLKTQRGNPNQPSIMAIDNIVQGTYNTDDQTLILYGNATRLVTETPIQLDPGTCHTFKVISGLDTQLYYDVIIKDSLHDEYRSRQGWTTTDQIITVPAGATNAVIRFKLGEAGTDNLRQYWVRNRIKVLIQDEGVVTDSIILSNTTEISQVLLSGISVNNKIIFDIRFQCDSAVTTPNALTVATLANNAEGNSSAPIFDVNGDVWGTISVSENDNKVVANIKENYIGKLLVGKLIVKVG